MCGMKFALIQEKYIGFYMRKTTIFTILLLVFGTNVNSFSNTLKWIDTVEFNEQLKHYFVFDTSPQFTTDLSGTRLSITFQETNAIGNIKLPPTNQDIVRYSIERKENDTIVSIFFRYIPDNFAIEKASASEIFVTTTIGNIYSNSYKNLAQRLKGLEKVSNTETRSLSPLATSIYRNNWKHFFDMYQPKHDINFPVELTWPPFPLINYLSPNFEINSTLLPPDLLKAGKNGKWTELKLRLPKLIENTKGDEQKSLLTFVYAEVLARNNNFEDSYRQASLLNKEFPNTQLSTLCRYLLILLHAKYIDPYLPKVELDEVFDRLEITNGLTPYVQVNKIETALATNDLENMNKLLTEDNLGFPINLSRTLSLRQADYWHALQQPIKAAAAYRIAGKDPQIPTLPYSRNGHCSSLFLQQKYDSANNCYKDLKDLTTNRDNLSLVNYMSTVSAGLSQGSATLNNAQAFHNLAASFPGTKGGNLAEIKILDIQARKNIKNSEEISLGDRYLNIANQAVDRYIREEAWVKAALSYYLGNDYKLAIDTLTEMRKQIRTGPLQTTSLALLIEATPHQIDLLYKNKKYKELILLIQRNRELLTRGWLKPKTSLRVAQSYYRLGLYEEAFSIFSYIVSSEHLANDDASELYVPLLTSGYNLMKFSQVIDYASTFQHFYPEGDNRNQINLLKSMAFFASGQEDNALTELPDTESGRRFALQIYYYQKKFSTVIDKSQDLPPQTDQEYFFVAESYYQMGYPDRARSWFEKIKLNSQHWAQAQYRQAEYYSDLGQKEESKQFSQNLINKEPNSTWAMLARKDI